MGGRKTFFKKFSSPQQKPQKIKKSTTVSLPDARWYHKIDTPQKIKTIVRNAVELVPPTALMIIQQKKRFVNSSFFTIFYKNFRQKRYIIENFIFFRCLFCAIFTKFSFFTF